MLIDNKKDRYPGDGFNIRTVWDFIREFAGRDIFNPEKSPVGQLDIVTGYFTLRALSVLHNELPEADQFRIVSSEMVGQDGEEAADVINLLNGDQSIDQVVNLSDKAREAKAFLERNTVQIKAITGAFCHAKAYMFRNDNPRNDSFYLTGSSNLTDAGLGLKASANVELNMGYPVKYNDNDYQEVCGWFEDIWKSASNEMPIDPKNPNGPKVSVKEYFIRQIEEYFRKYTPEEIYYKILFELFSADIDIDGGIEHTQDMSLLQTSVIWRTLFNYQQKGVISLIKMLRKYGGAILADAVGLGKTFSALAVIKYFQIQSYTTVVLCPKKLEQNWHQYRKGHNSRFEKDEFDYQVRFHTDLQNDRLENSYDDYKLDYLQTRKKVLVVIDESHNLRNEHSGRYQELINKLICNQPGQENRDVKVLMLSATPINTGLRDIKGQFNLIGHNQDDAFKGDDFGIDSLHNLFTEAQRDYTSWTHDDNRTIGQFIAMLPPKFFNLTDKLIVARTRKLIEKTLGEDLGFPEKDQPENIYQGVEHIGQLQTTDEIYAAFDGLSLTAYQPSLFLHESRKEAKREASRDWEDDVNRERFLVKMMGILFMKRLESCWYSCMTTVKKVLDVHERTLQLVNDFKAHVGDGTLPEEDVEDVADDEDDMLNDEYSLRKGTIRLSDMKNLGGFERGLRMDVNKLRAIYKNFEDFYDLYKKGDEKDAKLEKLVEILHNKQRQKNKKIVIFTAFADTAQFLFDELLKRGFTRMASVSGQTINTTGGQKVTDFTEVLQSFAPYSKLYKELDWDALYDEAHLSHAKYYDDENRRWKVPYSEWLKLVKDHRPHIAQLIDDGIDILIATDCLSEGQNLQDADMQVNYDIHWNPVRLIQRFGRIDRIGSPNNRIRCVNFWPAKSFDEYLHLESRIQDRMSMMTLVGSETQEMNDAYTKMIADNPLVDKNADRLLEELQHNSISDIESPRTLSLKDFSFEVYRQDLVDYLERYKDTFRRMPNGIYSGFRFDHDLFHDDLPESLVAVLGYPHREAGSKKPYTEIYLMCQPVDAAVSTAPTFHELNRADVLELLRRHKYQDRFVPAWIEDEHDKEKIARLSAILQQWMKQKAPRQAITNIKNLLGTKNLSAKKQKAPNETTEQHFRLENFDLIVWEYVSK
jgi:hypothetical protein